MPWPPLQILRWLKYLCFITRWPLNLFIYNRFSHSPYILVCACEAVCHAHFWFVFPWHRVLKIDNIIEVPIHSYLYISQSYTQNNALKLVVLNSNTMKVPVISIIICSTLMIVVIIFGSAWLHNNTAQRYWAEQNKQKILSSTWLPPLTFPYSCSRYRISRACQNKMHALLTDIENDMMLTC